MIKRKRLIKGEYILLLLVCLFCMRWDCFSQELPVYRQYMLNYFFINPAYTGIEGCNTIRLTNRTAWVGVENAPVTNTLSINSRFGDEGVGAYMYSHTNGPYQDWGGRFAYAHHMQLSSNRAKDKWPHLSFGVAGEFQKRTFDGRLISALDGNDPALKGIEESGSYGNVDAGAIYYTERYFISASMNQLIQQKSTSFDQRLEPTTQRYYTLSGAYRIENHNNSYALEPSLMFKMFADGRKMVDLNFKIYLMDIMWIAGSYRNNIDSKIGKSQGFIGYVCLSVLGKMKFAYGYDFGFNNMEEHYFGSHELMLSYQFCTTSKKSAVKCPAYFH